jgi:hypothetical protein
MKKSWIPFLAVAGSRPRGRAVFAAQLNIRCNVGIESTKLLV